MTALEFSTSLLSKRAPTNDALPLHIPDRERKSPGARPGLLACRELSEMDKLAQPLAYTKVGCSATMR